MVAATLMAAVLFGLYNIKVAQRVVRLKEAAFYNGLHRTAWAVSVSYMLVACSLGYGSKNIC